MCLGDSKGSLTNRTVQNICQLGIGKEALHQLLHSWDMGVANPRRNIAKGFGFELRLRFWQVFWPLRQHAYVVE